MSPFPGLLTFGASRDSHSKAHTFPPINMKPDVRGGPGLDTFPFIPVRFHITVLGENVMFYKDVDLKAQACLHSVQLARKRLLQRLQSPDSPS